MGEVYRARDTHFIGRSRSSQPSTQQATALASVIVVQNLDRRIEAPGAGQLMPLIIGARLGPYEITGTLGAGGMGEVYRARDRDAPSRRRVEDSSPSSFALDPDRLARFRREAQLLASLNHPNIGGDLRFRGQRRARMRWSSSWSRVDTLADRIARGPACRRRGAAHCDARLRSALSAAHEQGIIHRDLKPANIKLRRRTAPSRCSTSVWPNWASEAARAVPGCGNRSATADVSAVADDYLAGDDDRRGHAAWHRRVHEPEQAKGREADKRSDIWAFGCVLYEMLTGRRAFDGEDITDVLGRRGPRSTGLGGAAKSTCRRRSSRAAALAW